MTNTIDATEVDVVQEQIDNLRDKRREVDALYTQLENSHRIQKLIPDAFEHGACKQTWVNVGQETVKEKGIIGHLHSDNKKCGRTILTEKLSKVKSRQWVKKRREQRQIS